jgi:hypothetical protein
MVNQWLQLRESAKTWERARERYERYSRPGLVPHALMVDVTACKAEARCHFCQATIRFPAGSPAYPVCPQCHRELEWERAPIVERVFVVHAGGSRSPHAYTTRDWCLDLKAFLAKCLPPGTMLPKADRILDLVILDRASYAVAAQCYQHETGRVVSKGQIKWLFRWWRCVWNVGPQEARTIWRNKPEGLVSKGRQVGTPIGCYRSTV